MTPYPPPIGCETFAIAVLLLAMIGIVAVPVALIWTAMF
jgi:hypothetical protein